MNGHKEVTKQLGRYADAIATFSLGESIVFAGAALNSEPFCRALHSATALVIGCIVTANIAYFGVMRFCWKGTQDLQSGDAMSPVARRWAGVVWRFRVGVLLSALGVSIFGLIARPLEQARYH